MILINYNAAKKESFLCIFVQDEKIKITSKFEIIINRHKDNSEHKNHTDLKINKK